MSSTDNLPEGRRNSLCVNSAGWRRSSCFINWGGEGDTKLPHVSRRLAQISVLLETESEMWHSANTYLHYLANAYWIVAVTRTFYEDLGYYIQWTNNIPLMDSLPGEKTTVFITWQVVRKKEMESYTSCFTVMSVGWSGRSFQYGEHECRDGWSEWMDLWVRQKSVFRRKDNSAKGFSLSNNLWNSVSCAMGTLFMPVMLIVLLVSTWLTRQNIESPWWQVSEHENSLRWEDSPKLHTD